jgi:3-oxoacid CoA-transferase subunit A
VLKEAIERLPEGDIIPITGRINKFRLRAGDLRVLFSYSKGCVKMFFITGDTHRAFRLMTALCDKLEITEDDVLVLLGDAGINYYGGVKDRRFKHEFCKLPLTLFCIHGNYEHRPNMLKSYAEKKWRGGKVYVEAEFPNLLFAKDGELFKLAGKKCIVIGGAYRIDKPHRIANGERGRPEEQTSAAIRKRVAKRLAAADWKVDVVLSHTCPLKYEPRETFMQGVGRSGVDKSAEKWLDTIENKLTYEKWYCGHYHTSEVIGRMQFMSKDFREFQ